MLFLLFFLALGGSGYLAASPVARQSPSARSQQHKHASPRSTAHRLRSFTQPGLHSPERPRPGLVRVIAVALAPQRTEQRGMEPNHSRRKRGGQGRPGNNSNLGGGWDGGRGKLWGKWSSSSGCGSPPLTPLAPASGQSPPAVGSPSPATQASPEGWVLGGPTLDFTPGRPALPGEEGCVREASLKRLVLSWAEDRHWHFVGNGRMCIHSIEEHMAG